MIHKNYFKLDESLIVSRLHQKELLDIQRSADVDAKFFPLVTKSHLTPFFSHLPKDFALELQFIGNKVLSARFDRGFFGFGLLELLQGLSAYEALPEVSRLHILSPIFYQMALLLAFERLTDTPTSEHQGLHRAIALEFSRIAHHITVVKNIVLCLELTSLVKMLDELQGLLKNPVATLSRIHQEEHLSAKPVTLVETHDAVFDGLMLVEEIAALSHDDKLVEALAKKCFINITTASSLGLTGPFLRAHHVPYDLRLNQPLRDMYGLPPAISLTDGGDAWARLALRLLEIGASLRWLKPALYRFEKQAVQIDPIVVGITCCQTAPKKRFAFGEVEGPEGDVKIGIFTGASTDSYVARVRSPAYFIGQAIPHLFSHITISEIPLLLYCLGITPPEIDQ
ncbi:MAG TPA: hypothetical protein VEL47_07055 [Myxococcota bacterium]|nr:hypothetical protein [Myxococcota bacterium]